MAMTIHVDIVSAEGHLYSGQGEMIYAPAVMGEIGIAPRHAPLVTPLKPLEAMAQSRLVLASDVGGHRELIRSGENGQLFKSGEVAALQAAAIDLLRNRGGWQALRERGRAFVESERNWAASVRRYRDVYAAALEQGG